ncbi:MAG: hypothetical protein APG12_01106 [Candidatus Methanofastidiosum methylothiophilum]|uniref:Uncharacterized protein n=2 Tax=Candidatus Methanofastidiosum methylothiophilum TaxID=1705564 RepID=A0A150IYT2_9EURY|nr:MAG: hypothetical protein APG11_01150 [Candidatus Methanofastidiosum methylthiophilus]KYC50018.1 MAG: hypothetical protein APG12_01106 [Candidatus Methanofastidiosum methylthiophilus]
METCGICSRKIKDNLEMCYCSYCNMTFHFTCIEEQPCPNCGKILNIAHVRLGKPAEIFRKEENKDVFIEEVDIEQKSEPISPVEESFEKQGITEEIPDRMKGGFYPEEPPQREGMQRLDVPPMTPMVERGRTLRRREPPKRRGGMPKKKLLFILLVIALLIVNVVVILYVLNDGTIPFLNIKIGGGEATSKIFLNF